MAVERMSTGTNPVEVLDRVLDKGIVIDARLRVALAGSTWSVSMPAWWLHLLKRIASMRK